MIFFFKFCNFHNKWNYHICFIHPSAKIGNAIEHGAVVEKNCKIGNNTVVGSNSYIENTEVLSNSVIGANCTLGKDGAGFIFDKNKKSYFKIPHLGSLIIGKNVEIQSNCFVSKGTLDNTIIKNGTKIGPSSCVAHNVIIGNNCLLTGGNIIGGSSIIGNNTFMGLGSTVSNKIKLGHISAGRYFNNLKVTQKIRNLQ